MENESHKVTIIFLFVLLIRQKISLIYNSNKKITLKNMIYKYKLEIQIMKEY